MNVSDTRPRFTVKCDFRPWSTELVAGDGWKPQQTERRRRHLARVMHVKVAHPEKYLEWRKSQQP